MLWGRRPEQAGHQAFFFTTAMARISKTWPLAQRHLWASFRPAYARLRQRPLCAWAALRRSARVQERCGVLLRRIATGGSFAWGAMRCNARARRCATFRGDAGRPGYGGCGDVELREIARCPLAGREPAGARPGEATPVEGGALVVV